MLPPVHFLNRVKVRPGRRRSRSLLRLERGYEAISFNTTDKTSGNCAASEALK